MSIGFMTIGFIDFMPIGFIGSVVSPTSNANVMQCNANNNVYLTIRAGNENKKLST